MFGIFITARCGSTRLPKKHLREINGKYVLSYLIERISNEFKLELIRNDCEICIVTGNKDDNYELNYFENEKYVNVFFGSDNNIPLRHYQCANKKSYSYIISLDGDDILSSTIAMRSVQEQLKNGSDYSTTIGLPFGMNVSGYSTQFLNDSLLGNHNCVLENGWARIFSEQNKSTIVYESAKEPFRLSLDYYEDLEFFTQLINLTEDYIKADSDEFIETIRLHNLYKINGHLIEDYWASFRQKEKQEIENGR